MQTLKEAPIQIDNYTLLEKIGEGGYGTVFKAEQKSTGQLVAIKMLSFTATLDTQSRNHQMARFDRETRLCAEINHPNIVKLIDKGFTNHQEPFAVFEYVSGQTLKEYIQSQKGISASETGMLMGQVLDALVCAHASGIVHRDLKPHNIMVTQTSTKSYVKVLDFGIGTFTNDAISNADKNLTATKEVLGTPSYSAPEQLRGEPTTVKSDLYAWGLIFIECLTGQPVVQGDTVALIFQQQLSMTPIALPSAIVRHPLGALLKRVLEKDPRQRIPTVEQIIDTYTKINFNTIVGDITTEQHTTDTTDQSTAVNQFAWRSTHSEKRQLTVLCVKLGVLPSNTLNLDIETLEAIQKDQLSLCKDTGIRFGAYISGTLADTMIMYFGYPQASDTDARRAGRTALELMGQFQKRSALLLAQQGIALDIRIAIHSGTAYVQHKSEPDGIVTNLAFNLLNTTAPGQILVGAETKQLLAPYLEFEPTKKTHNTNPLYTTTTYLLTGERPAEALSHLSPLGAQQQMIGRVKEQNQIMDTWHTTASADAQAIVLQGQAGIGKSKLVYESKKQWINSGTVVLESRCLPEYRNNALYPIFEMLKSYLGLQDTTEESTPALTLALQKAGCDVPIVLPILHSWFAIPGGEQYETSTLLPERQKEVIFDTLKKCIVIQSKQQPFVLIVEDLHWIDPTSLAFITQLLQDTTTASYFIFCTARPEFETEWNHKRAQTINLKSLEDTNAAALIQGILQEQPIAPDTLSYIVERTDGIPLFIEDLTRMLLDQQYLIQHEGTYQLIPNFDTNSVPTTLKGLLHARLDGLGFAKETAQLAASIGRAFTYDLLIQSSLHDEAMVQADLNALLDANLIYHQRRIQNDSYIFRHALIRDAAYDSMVTTVRQDTHRRIADTLEHSTLNFAQENPFELARHLAAATQYQKAATYGLQAIQKQIKNSLNAEALQLHEIVKNWIANIKNELQQAIAELELNICVLAAVALKEGWGSQNQYDIAQRNNTLISQIKAHNNYTSEHHIGEFEVKNDWAIFSYLHAQSKGEEAKIVGEQLIQKSIQENDHKVEMAISSFLGQSYFISGDIQRAEALLSRVVERFDPKNDKSIGVEYGFDPYIFANGMLGFVHLFRGRPSSALQLYKNGVTYSKTTENDALILLAFLFMGCFLSLIDDKKLCKNYVIELHEILGDRFDSVWVSNLFYLIEDWVYDKTDIAEEKRTGMIAAGQSLVLSFYEPSMVKTYLQHKKYSSAITLLKESIERQTKHREQSILPITYNLLGKSLGSNVSKLTPEVHEAFKESILRSESMGFNLLKLEAIVNYSEHLLIDGQQEKAFSLLNSMESFCKNATEIKAMSIYKRYTKLTP